MCYCKISTISPELIFVQNAFFAGLIFGEAYFWRSLFLERLNWDHALYLGNRAKKSLSEARGLLLEGNRKRPKPA